MSKPIKDWSHRPWDGTNGFGAAMALRPEGNRHKLAKVAVEMSLYYVERTLRGKVPEGEIEERRQAFRNAFYAQACSANRLRPDHLG